MADELPVPGVRFLFDGPAKIIYRSDLAGICQRQGFEWGVGAIWLLRCFVVREGLLRRLTSA